MAKLTPQQAQHGTDTERSGATPVQFLPSMLLSWRTPIMARHGLPAKARRKTALDESIPAPQPRVRQPAPR